MTITLNYLLSRLIISTSFNSSSEVLSYTFTSFGTYSSIFSFCPIICVYFYVSVGLLHILILENLPYVVDILWSPSACSPLIIRAICSGDASYVSCMHTSLVTRPTNVSAVVGGTRPWLCLLRDTASCYVCGSVGGWVRLCVWLAAQPRVVWDFCRPTGGGAKSHLAISVVWGAWGWCQPTGGLVSFWH